MSSCVGISFNKKTIAGLQLMMQYAKQDCQVTAIAEIETAQRIVECAKQAEDLPSFFPHGKWSTIQAIQDRIERARHEL
jgi:hypothetical protein